MQASPTSQLKDSTECMEEACRRLTQVGCNLAGFLLDLNTVPGCLTLLRPDVERLETEASNLDRNIEALLAAQSQHLLTTAKQQASAAVDSASKMADRYAEIEELRSKMGALQRENEKLSYQLSSAQGDNVHLRAQLTHQSAFCASLGSVLGTLVWKASRVPPVVDLLLTPLNKAADFLCIVSGTLESFLETFNTEMPGPLADESQFIMAMGGIVTNMAAASAGRQFLVSDPNGRELIQQIVRVLPVIPTPSGNCLKRLLLMALYNVSINQEGLSLLHEDGKGAIFSVAADCLKPESTRELKAMALRILISLTCEINDITIIDKVPKQLIAEQVNSEDSELKTLAQDVMTNLTKAQVPQKGVGFGQSQGSIAKSPLHEMEGLDPKQKTTAWRLPTHR